MGFWDFLAILSGAKAGIKEGTKKQQKKEDFDWETHCESCGELLEDCECGNKELSMEDIALMDMLDEDDEMEEDEMEEDEEDENLSFDDFEALDDEDDEW